jgi:hypothetical protein
MLPRIFISYAHNDKEWKDSLFKHLSALKVEGLAELFHDGDIPPGGEWLTKIKAGIADSSIAILLVSSDFISSPNIMTQEIRDIMIQREIIVIPLIVRDCAWEALDFLSKHQARPFGRRALSSMEPAEIDVELTNLVKEIREQIKGSYPMNSGKGKPEFTITQHGYPITSKRDIFIERVLDGKALKYLEEINRRHAKISVKTGFNNDIMGRYLVDIYMKSYSSALEGCLRGELPLPSAPRMEAAMEVVLKSDEVSAVSVFSRDLWRDVKDKKYEEANIKAARQGAVIKRLVLVDKPKELAMAKKKFKKQEESRILVHYAIFGKLQKRMLRDGYELRPANVLIGDGQCMTLSNTERNHDGWLVLKQERIEQEAEIFNAAWEIVEDMK